MPSSNGIVFFNENAVDPLAFFIGYEIQPKWVVHLIGADLVMNHATTLAALRAAELPVATGYAPLDMPLRNGSQDWTLTKIGAGANAVYKSLTWTFTGPKTVYGYWYNNVTDNFSIMGEMFLTAFLFGATGGAFVMQPSFTLTSQP